MVQLQTISGFFDNAAEAQQAVQRLLAKGFTRKTVTFLTLHDQGPLTGEEAAEKNRSNGRFLSDLFGDHASVRLRKKALITVHSQSAPEATQIATLLCAAGAEEVTTEKRG